VFLKAFERFDTIGSSPSAAGWLKTVTRNACLNHLSRYRSRWRLFSELTARDAETDAETPYEAQLASDSSPADAFERAGERQHLENALRALPDHQRVPLVLFHFEQASYDDIASLLGVSVAKVKSDIHRGREALRTRLGGQRRHTPASHGSR